MKDRHHDDAMAEVYRNDPELAASLARSRRRRSRRYART